ncbi:MAG: hypothetical protein ACKOW8_12720, partial [Flavobacteriales bacterium]
RRWMDAKLLHKRMPGRGVVEQYCRIVEVRLSDYNDRRFPLTRLPDCHIPAEIAERRKSDYKHRRFL